MAVVRYGDLGPVPGLTAETTGFVQEFTCRTLHDEAEVPNEVGEVVAFGQFNKRYEGSYVLIDKSGASIPAAATAVAVANCTEATKVVITERERKPEQKGFQKYTLSFKAWTNLNLE
jgi:hypothetical protein